MLVANESVAMTTVYDHFRVSLKLYPYVCHIFVHVFLFIMMVTKESRNCLFLNFSLATDLLRFIYLLLRLINLLLPLYICCLY